MNPSLRCQDCFRAALNSHGQKLRLRNAHELAGVHQTISHAGMRRRIEVVEYGGLYSFAVHVHCTDCCKRITGEDSPIPMDVGNGRVGGGMRFGERLACASVVWRQSYAALRRFFAVMGFGQYKYASGRADVRVQDLVTAGLCEQANEGNVLHVLDMAYGECSEEGDEEWEDANGGVGMHANGGEEGLEGGQEGAEDGEVSEAAMWGESESGAARDDLGVQDRYCGEGVYEFTFYEDFKIQKLKEVQLGSLGPLFHLLATSQYDRLGKKVRNRLYKWGVHKLPHDLSGLQVENRGGIWYAFGTNIVFCLCTSVMLSCDGAWYSRYNSVCGHVSTRFVEKMPWSPGPTSAQKQRAEEAATRNVASYMYSDEEVEEDTDEQGAHCSGGAVDEEGDVWHEPEEQLHGLQRHPLVGIAVYCNSKSERARNCNLLAGEMEGHGWVATILLCGLLGIRVGGMLADGDGSLRKAPQTFGLPLDLLPELHLCLNHFCRILRKFIPTCKKKTGQADRVGMGSELQMHRLVRCVCKACWDVFSSLNVHPDQVTDAMCEEIRHRIIMNSLMHVTGQHEGCTHCGPNLAAVCPEAADGKWCDAHATEEQLGITYVGKCTDMEARVYDGKGNVAEICDQYYKAISAKFTNDKVRRLVGARTTNANECGNGVIATVGVDKCLGSTHINQLAVARTAFGAVWSDQGAGKALSVVFSAGQQHGLSEVQQAACDWCETEQIHNKDKRLKFEGVKDVGTTVCGKRKPLQECTVDTTQKYAHGCITDQQRQSRQRSRVAKALTCPDAKKCAKGMKSNSARRLNGEGGECPGGNKKSTAGKGGGKATKVKASNGTSKKTKKAAKPESAAAAGTASKGKTSTGSQGDCRSSKPRKRSCSSPEDIQPARKSQKCDVVASQDITYCGGGNGKDSE